MRVFLLLDRVAAVVGGVEQLAGETLGHRLLVTCPARLHQPAHAEGDAARLPDFHRNLVGRAPDPPYFASPCVYGWLCSLDSTWVASRRTSNGPACDPGPRRRRACRG